MIGQVVGDIAGGERQADADALGVMLEHYPQRADVGAANVAVAQHRGELRQRRHQARYVVRPGRERIQLLAQGRDAFAAVRLGRHRSGLSIIEPIQAIGGQRDRVFLVSKVSPNHVARDGIARACDASLARLGTDYLDLYLLHWPNRDAALRSIVAAFESLRAGGKIRAWGVSNFTVSDMKDLFRVPNGNRCATNQVLYNLGNRGIERDLLPWCRQHGMPVMAHSPLGGPGASLLRDPTLARIAAAHGCAAAAVALAWTIRNGDVIAIPGSSSTEHLKENAAALSLTLTPDELHTLEAAYTSSNR